MSCAHYVRSVLANSFLQVICIDSDDDDDFVEILPSRPTYACRPKRKTSSSPEPFQKAYGKLNDEQTSHKRPKHETEERANLPAPAIPNSPEGLAKAPKGGPKGRRGNSHHKFRERQLIKHIDNESRWFEAISKRYNDLNNLLKQ